jgi:hypothetical protein
MGSIKKPPISKAEPKAAPPKKARRPPGRPTTYSQKRADALCAELAMGRSLRSVCESKSMPSVKTVFTWMRKHEEFLQQYARAKEESADAMADEVLDIADDGHNDWMIRRFGNQEAWVENGEAVNRSKLRVDTRKWLMSKMKPKKYGDKLDLVSDGERLQTAPVIVSAIASRSNADAPTQGETS